MGKLIFTEGPLQGQTFNISNQVTIIGRESADISIDSKDVSRVHAELMKNGNVITIKDMASRNGTYLNDSKITETEVLSQGDVIRIGSTVIMFEKTSSEEQAHAPGLAPVEFAAEDPKKGSSTIELKLDMIFDNKKAPKKLGEEMESVSLSALVALSKLIGQERSLAKLLHKSLETLAKHVKADSGCVLLLHGNQDTFATAAVFGSKSEHLKVSRTIVKRTVEFGRAILTVDAGKDARFASSESIMIESIHSVISAPLISGGACTGVIYLHSGIPTAMFKQQDLELVAAFGIQLGMAVSNIRLAQKSQRTFLSMVKAFVTALEFHNPEVQGHSERVANFGVAIAREMHLSEQDVFKTYVSALLHDIGKLAVQQREKTEAFKHREEHVFRGEKMVSGIEGFAEFVPGIKYHHEKADGSGFPYKIKGTAIPVTARIIAVANAFDNLSSYSASGMDQTPVKQIVLDLANHSNDEYDAEVIKALLRAFNNNSLYSVKPPIEVW